MRTLLILVAFVATAAALGDELKPSPCAAPPVTTAEQAICLATKHLENARSREEWKTLRPEAFRHDDKVWVVTFVETRRNMVGGGANVTVDSESGKIIGGYLEQ